MTRPLISRGLAMACVGAVLALAAGRAQVQGIDFARTTFATEHFGRNLYVFTGLPGTDPGHPDGAGGRVAVLAGPDGVLMVDTSYAPLAPKILAIIRQITPAPIRFVVNTHAHPDHTGGNSFFARQGAVIVAPETMRRIMQTPPPPAITAAIGEAASFTDPDRLPTFTYSPRAVLTLRLDGEVIDLVAMPPAHTAGDTVVRFEHANVIMIGDFYRNYGYPFADSTEGGSITGILQAVDAVAALADEHTHIVPGHGGEIGRAELAKYQAMIIDVRANVKALAAQGATLQAVLAAHPTAAYDDRVPGAHDPVPVGAGDNADRFVAELYAEVNKGR